jgi:hypothetical protein
MAEMVQLSQSLQEIGHAQNSALQPSIGQPGTHSLYRQLKMITAIFYLATEGFAGQLDMSFISGATMRLSANKFAGTYQHDSSINDVEAL